MSVSIISCPKCKTLLLSDTAQCPTCQHVFDEVRAAEMASGPLPRAADSVESDVECQKCGEVMRSELVRCWKCGAFTRDEIAASYQQMRAVKSPVIYSDLPEGTSPEVSAAPGMPAIDARAGDDDFELAPGSGAIPRHVEGGEAVSLTSPAAPVEDPASYGLQQAAPDQPASAAPVQEAAAEPPTSVEATDEPSGEEGGRQDQSHSEATGGDVLLDIAIKEEAETAKRNRLRSKQRRLAPRLAPGAFIVFCPNGHRIEVHDRHRGLAGRCPKCKSAFHVPAANWDTAEASETGEAGSAVDGEGTPAVGSGKFGPWMMDVRLHTVDPAKLKLKAESLANLFTPADLGASPEGLLVAEFGSKGGLFGSGDKKKLASAREALHAHLEAGKPVGDVPAGSSQFIEKDALSQLQVVQPAYAVHESMFAGIDVFGVGRIAIRLPAGDEAGALRFLSFALSDYREFAQLLTEIGDAGDLTQYGMIPLEDVVTELECHYSERKLSSLEHFDYYQADPAFKLELLGRKCQACGIVVGEDSRKKERIGGKTGKGIAKAKCPKCGAPFGSISLYGLSDEPASVEKPADADSAVPK